MVIPDVWLASVVMQYDGHLVSFDADFSKLLLTEKFTRLI